MDRPFKFSPTPLLIKSNVLNQLRSQRRPSGLFQNQTRPRASSSTRITPTFTFNESDDDMKDDTPARTTKNLQSLTQ